MSIYDEITLHIQAPFTVGTTLSVYEGYASDSGHLRPIGPPLASAVVDAQGDVTFTGLTEGTPYVAGARISGEWTFISFSIPARTQVPPDLAKLGEDDTVGGPGGSPLSPSVVSGSDIPDATSGQIPVSNGDGTWSPGEAAPSAPTKRVSCPIQTPRLSNPAGAYDWCQRMLLQLPVATARWRLRISNVNVLLNEALSTPGVITAIYAGTPAYESSGARRWTGNFTATPTLMAEGPFTVPVDGSDLVTPWITSEQFAPYEPLLISLGVKTEDSGSGLAKADEANPAYIAATLGSAQVGSKSLTGAVSGGGWFDIRVEYEFEGNEAVGVFLGDSITQGFGDGDVSESLKGTLVNEAWPWVAGLRGGFCAINLGIDSATAETTFISGSAHSFTRADLVTTVPDFAAILLGTNDLGGSKTVAEIQGFLATVVANLRTKGIKAIYLSTIIPRSYTEGGTLSTASTVGATTIESSVNTGTGMIRIGSGRTQENATVSKIEGSGPYILTVGALTKAHAAGVQIVYLKELRRQEINDWIRQLPAGVIGILDFDYLMATPVGGLSSDPRVMSEDGLHPLRGGYARMGTLASSLLQLKQ